MSKRRRYRSSAAGAAVGARRRPGRWWRSRRLWHLDGAPEVLVTFGCPPGEAYLMALDYGAPKPMAVMTRPQDWAPNARAILWPHLDELERAARARQVMKVTGL